MRYRWNCSWRVSIPTQTANVRTIDFLDGGSGPFSSFSSVQWNDEDVSRRDS